MLKLELVVAALLLASSVTSLTAQSGSPAAQAASTYEACYVPDVGAIYLINQTGLPTACLASTHIAISWTAGGDLADGSVTEPKLAFDPATQAELDAFIAGLAAAGTINTTGNPVDWTQLMNVPAEFADGVDNTGGTPSDLVCTDCVGTTDLAAAGHLAFDPATQTELDAHAASADHDGRYFTETELRAGGTINTTGNPMDWTQLKNVPADFADGVDDTGGGVTDHAALTGLANDDHPQYALAGGVRSTSNGFALTGTFGSGTIPVSGEGTRLMWYPGNAAFRTGTVNGTQWEDVNVGVYSAAMGWNTTASSDYSTAMGRSTIASGGNSTAMGAFTTASGDCSTAMGIKLSRASLRPSDISRSIPLMLGGSSTTDDLLGPPLRSRMAGHRDEVRPAWRAATGVVAAGSPT